MGIISTVIPLEDYRLLVELDTGSSITVNLAKKLKTIRFSKLSDISVFENVKFNSETIVWGDGVLTASLPELIDVAVKGI